MILCSYITQHINITKIGPFFRLIFEFPPTGGVIPSSNFYTLKLIRYATALDMFVLGCELIFIGFILYYTIEEVQEIKYYRMKSFTRWWNYIDFSILLVNYLFQLSLQQVFHKYTFYIFFYYGIILACHE